MSDVASPSGEKKKTKQTRGATTYLGPVRGVHEIESAGAGSSGAGLGREGTRTSSINSENAPVAGTSRRQSVGQRHVPFSIVVESAHQRNTPLHNGRQGKTSRRVTARVCSAHTRHSGR